jgi:PAS domain S-box-containing protein
MITPLNILIAEDSPEDAELLVAQLRRAGFDPQWRRVETEPDFLAGLEKLPDLILSDYSMPHFSGLRAMLLLQEREFHIPLILVSGTVGEEAAVEAMKHGAADYLLKDRILRLGPAVERALEQKRLRAERQQTLEELRWKTALLEAQLNASIDGILVVDSQGKQVLENPRMNELWKVPEHMLGDQDDATKLVFAASRTKAPQQFIERVTYLYAHPDEVGCDEIELIDGTILERYSSPVRDGTGRFYGRIWNFRDITERKRAEAALVRSHEQYRRAIIAANAIPYQKDYIADKYVFMGEGIKDLTGYGPAELRSSVWKEIILETQFLDEAAGLPGAEAVRRILAGELKCWHADHRIRTRSGEFRWISDSAIPLLDADGKYAGSIGIIQDITERKQADGELRWRTAFFEALSDSILDGILVLDRSGKRVIQNRRFSQMFKIPDHSINEMAEFEMIRQVARRAKNADEFNRQMTYIKSHPDAIGYYEIELSDGTVLERYHAPVRDKAGNHYGRIWTFRDITERRKLEAQFRQAQKMEGIGQLAGGVAHDFNNMLATIQMNVDLLRIEDNITPAQLEIATEIGGAAQRAAALTRQLLLFSRKETMQLRDLDLTESINEMTKMLRRTLGEEIQIKFKFAMQSLFLHADASMLDQVLLNLAVNARDAMPHGGRLIIETSAVEFDETTARQNPQTRPGSFVCLSVSDTGGGIPPEILPRIFEPFFTTKEVGKGTGLGLATVFGIVQQHQGWINVYSEVGQGTTFRIYLPRLAARPRQNPEAAALPAVRGKNETILLVEDNSFLHHSMRNILLQLGYRVLAASHGIGALNLWKQHRAEIQLLLTDLVMPGGMTGKDLGRRLLQENPKLKVIYTSGYSADIITKELRLQEGVNFLGKPFDAHQLAQIIRNRLDEDEDSL